MYIGKECSGECPWDWRDLVRIMLDIVAEIWRLLCGTVWWLMLFFFFQAEDGIRDYKVTGVQTCALPICLAVARVICDSEPTHRSPVPFAEGPWQDSHGQGYFRGEDPRRLAAERWLRPG